MILDRFTKGKVTTFKFMMVTWHYDIRALHADILWAKKINRFHHIYRTRRASTFRYEQIYRTVQRPITFKSERLSSAAKTSSRAFLWVYNIFFDRKQNTCYEFPLTHVDVHTRTIFDHFWHKWIYSRAVYESLNKIILFRNEGGVNRCTNKQNDVFIITNFINNSLVLRRGYYSALKNTKHWRFPNVWFYSSFFYVFSFWLFC